MSRPSTRWLVGIAVLCWCGQAVAAGNNENHFASIHLDDDKIGQVHYTVTYGDEGEIEELETRASVSILGFEVFSFTQQLQETWQDGELQTLNGHTDDDGDVYESSLERDGESYTAVLNGQSMDVPLDAFPMSLWHYRITEQSKLFDLKDFRLMNVEVAESEETIAHDGRSVVASRFAFSGDWEGTIWFDEDRVFLQAEYEIEGRKVVVTLDRE